MIPFILAAVGGYLIGDSFGEEIDSKIPKFEDGGMTDVRMKYAKKDITLLMKEGGMSMYDTKYGVLHLSYKDGVFTIKNNKYNTSKEDYETIFKGDKEGATKFVANSYIVEEMADGGMMADKYRTSEDSFTGRVNWNRLDKKQKSEFVASLGLPHSVSNMSSSEILNDEDLKDLIEFNSNIFIGGESDSFKKKYGRMADGGMMAKGGMTEGEKIYKIANEMTDSQYENKISKLNKEQKSSYESLIRLGDSPKLALATVLVMKKPNYSEETIRAYTMADGGMMAKGGSVKKEYLFHFVGGGWNSVFAKDKAEAIKKAKDLYEWGGYKSDGEFSMDIKSGLKVDDKSFRVSTKEDYDNLMRNFD